MSYLAIAQYMAASAFLTIALIHLLVWFRAHSDINHLLFAFSAASAGANALAELWMYQADSIDAMCAALRWYVATSGIWAITTACFFAAFGKVGRVGWYLTIAIMLTCFAAMMINLFSPASFLFNEVIGLREIVLPWGERIWLAIGNDNPLRIATDLAFLSILGVVADGCYQLWRRDQRTRALFFGATVFTFMACFFVHAYLVDTGRLDFPYLSTYGFLALVVLTSYELAGEVMRISELSSELVQKEDELQSIVEEERSRIAGELHDSVTQTLFSSAAIADALPEVWKRNPDEAMRGLESLKQLSRSALAEMRTLLMELHPAFLLKHDLGKLLRQLASATTGRSHIAVEVKTDGDMRCPDEVQVALYRVAQESINNAVKHARANHIWLSLVCRSQRVTLTIRDDGRGFDVNDLEANGMGLEIMRERVNSINARLEEISGNQGGTTVRVQWTADPNEDAKDEL